MRSKRQEESGVRTVESSGAFEESVKLRVCSSAAAGEGTRRRSWEAATRCTSRLAMAMASFVCWWCLGWK